MEKTLQECKDTWQTIYELSLSQLRHFNLDDLPYAVNVHNRHMEGRKGLSWNVVRDTRTIHMGGGRQNGKTSWAIDFINAHPGAIVVECNSALRDDIIAKYGPGMRTRVFTVRDLVNVLKKNRRGLADRIASSTHVIFNDASFNYMISDPGMVGCVDGLFGKDVIVIMLG